MDKFFRWFGLPGAVVLTTLLSALALFRAVYMPVPVRWICFAAMAFSSLGDLFLAHLKPLTTRFKNCFAIGAVFFMAAHLLYAVCYGMRSAALSAPVWNIGAVGALFLGILAAAVLVPLAIREKTTAMLPLFLPYLCMILLSCAAVFSYAKTSGTVSARFAALGALSFLLSDFIIGLSRTGKIRRFNGLIWWLYPIGQLFLILGA